MKTVIQRVYEQCLRVKNIDGVYIATDSSEIEEVCRSFTNHIILTKNSHQSGTDRIGEAVAGIDCDVVVNVQGDEPFIDKESLSNLLNVFKEDKSQTIDLASLMTPLVQTEDIENPNNVKVIVDSNQFALYFSRSPIPYPRATDTPVRYFKHVGIYAFRKQALMDFYNSSTTPLEAAEKIECIRHLEHGKKIKMVETSKYSIGIDTPEDLEKAIAYLTENS